MDAYKQSKLNEAKADIRAQMAANGELDGLTEAQINKKIVDSAQYQSVDKEYGVGSNFWTNGSAATGLLAGVLGGNVTGGMAAGAAPYMAALVKDSTDNPAARAALHAIVSGALASAQGANPGAAAVGGFIASASADALAMAFYGTTADKLVGDEKTMISNLVVLFGAAAGAATGGDGQALASGGEVENNALNSKNVLDMHQELAEAERTGGDKLAIYEKYAEIAEENRKAAIAESCSGDPFCANGALAEAQAGKDIVNSLNRLSMFSDLSSEDLAQLTRFVLAENDESASAIYQALPDYVKVALHSKEAAETLGLGAAVGGKGLAALGVIGKSQSNKSSALPTPNATQASNGLNYISNPKHTPGQIGYHRGAGTEPKDSIVLFGSSVAAGKKRYALDQDGNVHQFTNGNDGTWHWSGSTGDKTVPLDKNRIPSSVKKELGVPKKGW